jgi:hypothetical protein
MYRELAIAGPARYRYDLACVLATLSGLLLSTERVNEGLNGLEEATQIHREIITEHPETPRVGLQQSLQLLAAVLPTIGRGDEVEDVVRELAGLQSSESNESIQPQI